LYLCEKVRIKCLEIKMRSLKFTLLNFSPHERLDKLKCYAVNTVSATHCITYELYLFCLKHRLKVN